MDDGKIVENGAPAELMESPILKGLLQAQADVDEKLRAASEDANEPQSSDGAVDEEEQVVASDGIQQATAEEETSGLMDGSEKQDPAEGLRSMMTYLRHAGVGYGVVTVGLHGVDVLLEVLSTQWLSWWAVDRLSIAAMAYLRGYVGIALLQSALRVVRQVVAAKSVMRAARVYHERCLSSLMGSALSFFHVTPHGRILTRFAGDLSKIDSNYHKEVFEVVDMGMQLLGTGCVLLLTSGWFALAIPPIALAYRRIQMYFTHASREVQHLAGAAEHPISSHLGESLSGTVTIRCDRQEKNGRISLCTNW
jgi:ABC-type multidrug transport system fused ATPase/permease subunit